MDDAIVWIIIIAFYAPLHYLLPVLFLFVTGKETEAARKRLIFRALVDSTWSMIAAFIVIIYLAGRNQLPAAMFVMLLSMGLPFVRIWSHRRELAAETD